MNDFYNGPTLAILGILVVAVFAALYMRSRTPRSLLWLLGWTLVDSRLFMQVTNLGGSGSGWILASLFLELPPLMFITSMTSTSARISYREHFKWITALSLPLGVYLYTQGMIAYPGRLTQIVAIVSVVVMVAVAIAWAAHSEQLSRYAMLLPIILGPVAVYFAVREDAELLLELMHSTSCFTAAVLVLLTYKRFSTGVIFTSTGLLIWCLPILLSIVTGENYPVSYTFVRLLNIAKVATAIGMVVLALEDELLVNEDSQRRDRRTRAEMAEYSRLFLASTLDHDFDAQYQKICEVITRASRFSQAAILQRNLEQEFQVVCSAGMHPALKDALIPLGKCLTDNAMSDCFGEIRPAARGTTRLLHVKKFKPGGLDMKSPDLHPVYAIPFSDSSNTAQGALILHGLRSPEEPLDEEDMLPLELLVSRLVFAQKSSLLLRRVVQSEKMAGLGRLTGGVAHELNNPLTVVMGYAELITEAAQDETIRGYAKVIQQESQRMRRTIESLARFSKASQDTLSSISLEQMLRDIEQLRQPEFERSGISLEVTLDENLPLVRANGEQIRQVLLQILNNASTALKGQPAHLPRQVRIHARLGQEKVHVLILDTGPGFPDVNRVFDPFFTTKAPGEGPGLGLSLCYSIIREHGGEISVSNLQPYGAAVSIEMPIDGTSTSPFTS